VTTYTTAPATDLDGIQSVIDIAQQATEPFPLETGRVYAVTTPRGVERIDLTGIEYKEAPDRKTGTTVVRDSASFLAYFAKHSDDNTEVYADAERLTTTAILDANTREAARWESHRLALILRRTEAWQQWIDNDGRLMKQDAFAEFIQDHLPELRTPSAAEMLEIAQSIQGVSKAEFQSGSRLSDGRRQFQYVETVTAKAGQKGQLEIPDTFVVGLVPFEGSEGYELTARFRYRIGSGGELTMGYKLERPTDTLRAAFADVVTAISSEITVPVMNGTPA
jgi:uncharacterized protein YfdQ (DUF2303 family)